MKFGPDNLRFGLPLFTWFGGPIRFLAKAEGYQAVAVNSHAALVQALESQDFDAVLMDLN